MDRIDRELVQLLVRDGRATYQELGRAVQLSPNTVADRVRRLRASGMISGIHAELNLKALGRSLVLLADVRLREGHGHEEFLRGLEALPQIISAAHVTGEYDYQLRVVCRDADEFEQLSAALRDEHGVVAKLSRLVLREVDFPMGRVLD